MNWRKHASVISLASAALSAACAGNYEIDVAEVADDAALQDASGEYVADENGTVLGTSWQALSYPYCMSPFSDPDGDGWGWEYGRSCVVYRPPTTGAYCANGEGTASTMAALAVSAAMELGRWQPTKDFAIGRIGSSEALVLSATGRARCVDDCANTQALLDFQKEEASGKVMFPGGVTLNSAALRSRLV